MHFDLNLNLNVLLYAYAEMFGRRRLLRDATDTYQTFVDKANQMPTDIKSMRDIIRLTVASV